MSLISAGSISLDSTFKFTVFPFTLSKTKLIDDFCIKGNSLLSLVFFSLKHALPNGAPNRSGSGF
jgi:hypothetical protein